VAWDQQGRSEICSECKEFAIKNEPNAIKRAALMGPVSCDKHGDPRFLTPCQAAWIELYSVVAPYSTSQTTLDHILISKICEAHDIPFLYAFERLTTIHEMVSKYADKGVYKCQEGHAGAGA